MTSRRALICSWYMPQADLDSFSRRLFHLVEFLREAGWAVTCLAKDPTGVEQFATFLEEGGVPVHVGLEENLERLATEEHFDVAILGFWYVAETAIKVLRRCSPGTRLIVDSGDLHFLRLARRIFREAVPGGDLDLLDARYASETVRELNVYAAADAVFAVSRKEADFVSDFLGDSERAFVVPDCEDLCPSPVPFAQRRGMFFVGNFQHHPNVEAVEFLCKEVLPQFDPALLAGHPVYIAGNAMTNEVRRCADGLPFVRLLGWVPSIFPYLERVRVSLVPLLHGAGTKRKMIQALAVGTPTVSTTVGVEGFRLHDEEEVLLADDPVAFANAIARLLADGKLWERLARQGRTYMLAEHGKPSTAKRLLETLDTVLTRPRRSEARRPGASASSRMTYREYQRAIRRTHEQIQAAVPQRSTILVVSKGDDELLNIDGRTAWHYPQAKNGIYAGYYPADSAEAIAHLETLRAKGADFLVFPKTAFWWLDHYADFKHHLDSRYRLVTSDRASCIIYSLRKALHGESVAPMPRTHSPGTNSPRPEAAHETANGQGHHPGVRLHRPAVLRPGDRGAGVGGQRGLLRILIVGVYLADRETNIDDIVHVLSDTDGFQVVQRWAALGGVPPTPRVANVTARVSVPYEPKFVVLNNLLTAVHLDEFEYVVVCDDDVFLPEGFLDSFLDYQSGFAFALAQPTLTADSFINHPIVEQQRGTVARQTRFVEIGPVFSCHREAYPHLFPFDVSSPMGWGYEAVWAGRLARHGQKMGIIDAVPVSHGLRRSVSTYQWDEANRQREEFLARQREAVVDDPFRILAVGAHPGGDTEAGFGMQRCGTSPPEPRVSVVIPTRNRASLLESALESLARQSLPAEEFETIIVDDGSTDETPDLCARWAARLALTTLRIQPSGIAAAKNMGVFAARSPILFFFDDDDVADKNLLAEHLKTHARYPMDNVAVLGYTRWAPWLPVSEVMRYVTDIGHYLFSYTPLAHGQRLDFTYFWGGRSSCKKSLLTRTGVFRQEFEFGSEDIELGFRISKRLLEWRLLHREFEVDQDDEDLRHLLSTVGLAVIYNRNAIQYMNRPLTYDQFCQRCERQGKSQMQFCRLYGDSIVHHWCQTDHASERWLEIRHVLPEKVARVHEIERQLEESARARENPSLLAELHRLYGWTFDGFKVKGMVESTAAGMAAERAPAQATATPGL